MNGVEPSRRDDLISLGYVWVYLFKGALPWQNLELAEGESRLQAIRECKEATTCDQLCSGMPPEFIRYFEIINGLNFDQEPPYAELRSLFRDCFIQSNFSYDGQWDWMAPVGGEASRRPARLTLTSAALLKPRQYRSAPGIVGACSPAGEEQAPGRGKRPPLMPGKRHIGTGQRLSLICVPTVASSGHQLSGRRRSLDSCSAQGH
jgi:hypothetical protein